MSDARCQICNGPVDQKRLIKICESCRDRLGIIDMPPARRPLAPCSKCGGTKLIRAIPRDHTATPGENGEYRVVPMRLSVAPAVADRLLSSRKRVADPQPGRARGLLEAYVCRGCGYVEWYCADPEKIPIGPEYMTEEIDVGGGKPYR